MIKRIWSIVLFILLGITAASLFAAPASSRMAVDDKTVFLLQVDGKTGNLVDLTGRFNPSVKGARAADDQFFGKCLDFGSDASNIVSVADGGKINFKEGFTLEAWVYFKADGKPHPGGTFANKFGSFWFNIKNMRLNNGWITFPTDTIYTTTDKQFKYHPVETEGFGGATEIPANQWVHLAVTYDQNLKVIRTWIDGGIDRTRYMVREDDAPVSINPRNPVELLRGMKDCKLGSVRLSQGARKIGDMPLMETYVQQLPYQGKVAVTFDHIDKSLQLPLDIRFMWENPNGGATALKGVTLDSHNRKSIIIQNEGWKGALYTLHIRAYQGNKQVYYRSARIANVKPDGRIAINNDKSISVDGKKIFPIFAYHAFPEDFAELYAMGFNIITPRAPSLRWMGFGANDEQEFADMRTCLNEAKKNNAYICLGTNSSSGHLVRVPKFKDDPALLFWYAYDEPWGSLDRLIESYNTVKTLDPGKPVFSAQNNATRYAETAEGADIVACDPYPIPNVSLRAVAYSTEALVKSVDGLKPVWTVLDQYVGKQPNLAEMRCMMYLALTSGANGIGIYAWDDRPKKTTGWYTKEHPEDLEVLKKSVAELKSLEEILIIPNSTRKLTWAPANKALHAAVKEAGGKAYLFVANDSRKAESGTLTIDGIADAAGICLADGANKEGISIKGGRIDFKLAPLAAAVYEIKSK
ncbi:MAG: LamG-like jellyroll fold domain-containing protein [Armatimonadota bacterium]|jgi:hypothetical protein